MRLSIKIILLAGVLVALVGLYRHHPTRPTTAKRVSEVATTPQINSAVATVAVLPFHPGKAASTQATVQTNISSITIPSWLIPVITPPVGVRYADRIKVLQARTGKLTGDDIQALYSYLLTPTDADSRPGENWLRNVMMDMLVEQQDLPAGLAATLVSIYQDTNQDIVMRDYAVQHIDPAYHQSSPDEQAQLSQTLWQATSQTDSSIAGTALLALENLAKNNQGFDQNQITQTALKLAEDEQCGELSRITAVQLCGQMDVEQAAPLVMNLAQSAPSIPLQIAAIAALGNLGDRNTETFLEQIAIGSNDRLKPAAQTALKHLQQRLGT